MCSEFSQQQAVAYKIKRLTQVNLRSGIFSFPPSKYREGGYDRRLYSGQLQAYQQPPCCRGSTSNLLPFSTMQYNRSVPQDYQRGWRETWSKCMVHLICNHLLVNLKQCREDGHWTIASLISVISFFTYWNDVTTLPYCRS